MIRFGAAATNALASRAGPAAVSVLPPTAVIAFASRHGTRVQLSSCTNCSCSRCNSDTWSTVATNACSTSRGSCSTSPTTGNRRVRGLGAAPLRNHAVLSTSASSLAASDPSTGGVVTSFCDPSAYQSLSQLILLYECIRRVYGSPLLETSDLLTLPTQIDSLPCCIVLLVPENASTRCNPPRAASAAGATSNSLPLSSTCGSVAAPTTNISVRRDGYQHGLLELGTTTADDGNSSSSSNSGSTSVRCCSCSEEGDASSTSSSSSSSTITQSAAGQRLRVEYLNRAALEALGASSSGSESGIRRMEVVGLQTEALCTMFETRGPPRKGTTHMIRLSLESIPGGGLSNRGDEPGEPDPAPGRDRAIHCPEALVLPLMSPNGACAGIAVLFERWEVRDAAGGVVLEGRPLVPEMTPGSLPGEEALWELQQRVRAQADEVRQLKSQQGLTNKDGRVVAAVATLQQLKADLDLQQRLHRAFDGEFGVLRTLHLHESNKQDVQ